MLLDIQAATEGIRDCLSVVSRSKIALPLIWIMNVQGPSVVQGIVRIAGRIIIFLKVALVFSRDDGGIVLS